MIATYMRAQAGLNEKLFLEFDLVQSLRYGENPHQSARFYREGKKVPYSLAFARQLNGKELSYNNIQDANARAVHRARVRQALLRGPEAYESLRRGGRKGCRGSVDQGL